MGAEGQRMLADVLPQKFVNEVKARCPRAYEHLTTLETSHYSNEVKEALKQPIVQRHILSWFNEDESDSKLGFVHKILNLNNFIDANLLPVIPETALAPGYETVLDSVPNCTTSRVSDTEGSPHNTLVCAMIDMMWLH